MLITSPSYVCVISGVTNVQWRTASSHDNVTFVLYDSCPVVNKDLHYDYSKTMEVMYSIILKKTSSIRPIKVKETVNDIYYAIFDSVISLTNIAEIDFDKCVLQ